MGRVDTVVVRCASHSLWIVRAHSGTCQYVQSCLCEKRKQAAAGNAQLGQKRHTLAAARRATGARPGRAKTPQERPHSAVTASSALSTSVAKKPTKNCEKCCHGQLGTFYSKK